MALSEIDHNLLQRCLARKPRSWEDFVDRFMGLIFHVLNHVAQARSVRLSPEDRDDICADIFLEIIKNDFALLRNFRGTSSLATYLTVVARRIAVRKLAGEKGPSSLQVDAEQTVADPKSDEVARRVDASEEVDQLLAGLHGKEADIVRLYHLQGLSYRDISARLGIPENSIGATLSRVRARLRPAD